LVERQGVNKVFSKCGGKPGAFVGHFAHHVVASVGEGDLHAPTARRDLERVVDQVFEDQQDQVGVAVVQRAFGR